MKHLYLCFLFTITSYTFISAQTNEGLVITYNLYTDQVQYTRNGIPLDHPIVKAQERISVIVTEFNPHVFNASVEVSKINYLQTSASGNSSLFGLGSMGSSGMGSLLGNLNLGSGLSMSGKSGSGGGSFGFAKRKLSAEQQQAVSKYEQLDAQFEAAEKELTAAHKKLQLFQVSEKSKEMALADISSLKNNANIRPSRIKELIEEEIRYAFNKTEGESIDIDDLVDEMKVEADLAHSVDNYTKAKKEYEVVSGKWSNYATYLGTVPESGENATLIDIKNTSVAKLSFAKTNLEKLERDSIESRFSNYRADLNAVKMALLRQEYEELQGNIFICSFPPILAEQDVVDINIKVTKKDEKGNYQQYKTISQKVDVEGNWRITGGVGLSFAILKNQTFKYSVIDNKIIEDELDEFVPVVVSFAHIYKQKRRGVNFAGSFGVGMPISSEGSIKSITFFMGPSIILGKQQRMLISAGVMGAKVTRLGFGFKTGDSFNNIGSTLPYTDKYELGYFIGISYDIL